MTKFNTKQLMLSTTVALMMAGVTACGGSDSANNNSQPSTPADELAQAKEFINTAKLFVNDSAEIEKAYSDVGEIVSEDQLTVLSNAINFVGNIQDHMEENNLSSMTRAQLEQTANERHFIDGSVKLTDNFSAVKNADGTVTVNGSAEFTVEDYVGNEEICQSNGLCSYESIYNNINNIVTFDTANAGLTDSSSGNKVNIGLSFKSITVGTGTDKLVFKATDAVTAQATMSEVISDGDGIKALRNTENINDAKISVNGVTLESGDATLEATKLDIDFITLDYNAYDQTYYEFVPYNIAVEGKFVKDSPKTNATVTLNLSTNKSAAENYLIASDNGIDEKENVYLPMTVSIGVKGDMTKDNNTVIPLDINATLKRDAKESAKLENMTVSFEGKAINVVGENTLDGDKLSKMQLTLSQGNASAQLVLDEASDGLVNNDGKIADIKVNDNDYGDIIDDGTKVSAVFSDNSVVIL